MKHAATGHLAEATVERHTTICSSLSCRCGRARCGLLDISRIIGVNALGALGDGAGGRTRVRDLASIGTVV